MPEHRERSRFRTVPVHVGLGAVLGAAAFLLIAGLDLGRIGAMLAVEPGETELFLALLGVFSGHGAVGSGLTAFYFLAVDG